MNNSNKASTVLGLALCAAGAISLAGHSMAGTETGGFYMIPDDGSKTFAPASTTTYRFRNQGPDNSIRFQTFVNGVLTLQGILPPIGQTRVLTIQGGDSVVLDDMPDADTQGAHIRI